ncbi:MAG: hypothetical protein KVP17_004989 [Porospora cf. gigantea B]|uniref:uncharacterized protein n=1 Tax=Porospora cf. gigantea B TaxID=2853592 RepID=UPI003571C723|nr:MAG: hypothetical protein KVP17_004989 [Porospora cf. gigantea B]
MRLAVGLLLSSAFASCADSFSLDPNRATARQCQDLCSVAHGVSMFKENPWCQEIHFETVGEKVESTESFVDHLVFGGYKGGTPVPGPGQCISLCEEAPSCGRWEWDALTTECVLRPIDEIVAVLEGSVVMDGAVSDPRVCSPDLPTLCNASTCLQCPNLGDKPGGGTFRCVRRNHRVLAGVKAIKKVDPCGMLQHLARSATFP